MTTLAVAALVVICTPVLVLSLVAWIGNTIDAMFYGEKL